MSIELGCDWCVNVSLPWRTFYEDDYVKGFVSIPAMQEGHCLVIPTRHRTQVHELSQPEAFAYTSLLGRVGMALTDEMGKGYVTYQKHAPFQHANGVKMEHLHSHVLPILPDEENVFPVPPENTYRGFFCPEPQAVAALTARLREKLQEEKAGKNARSEGR